MRTLLAVDLGLRTGLALYGEDGRLRWYRSKNFGTRSRLRHGAHGVLGDLPELAWLLLEGGGALADLWAREGERRQVQVRRVDAQVWRQRLLYPSERRTAEQAKASAEAMARRVIAWAGADAPTSLRHDAAEAVLVGLWGVLTLGWLPRLPDAVKQR